MNGKFLHSVYAREAWGALADDHVLRASGSSTLDSAFVDVSLALSGYSLRWWLWCLLKRGMGIPPLSSWARGWNDAVHPRLRSEHSRWHSASNGTILEISSSNWITLADSGLMIFTTMRVFSHRPKSKTYLKGLQYRRVRKWVSYVAEPAPHDADLNMNLNLNLNLSLLSLPLDTPTPWRAVAPTHSS